MYAHTALPESANAAQVNAYLATHPNYAQAMRILEAFSNFN